MGQIHCKLQHEKIHEKWGRSAKIALKSAMGTQVDGLSDCFIPTNAEVRATRSEPNYGPKLVFSLKTT